MMDRKANKIHCQKISNKNVSVPLQIIQSINDYLLYFFSIYQILEPISLLPMFYMYNSVFDFTAKPKYTLDMLAECEFDLC